MRNAGRGLILCLLSAVVCQGICRAQDAPVVATTKEAPAKPQPKFYKLEFIVEELDAGKVINARTYTAAGETDNLPESIRTDSRVPIPNRPGSTEYQQVDLAVNIDFRGLTEQGNNVALHVSAEVRSIPQESTTAMNLVIRHNQWSSGVIVPIGKSTVIFSSDDVTTKHKTQVELKATPIP
ncbi:MAG TPA: hypothetical protein VH325_16535 [Bryobacteraceae bacterium]|nr:hypothetical protein [Bryobacteraceae bacterium]